MFSSICDVQCPVPRSLTVHMLIDFFLLQQCAGSICEKYGLEECTCASTDGKDDRELCHVCCKEKILAACFQAHWWAVLLMGIALIMLMAGFIKICSVHTPSSNPKLPPPKPLPGTLKRRRAQNANPQPQRQRQPRENYQMGQMRR
ncbi:UNVERIFIED_CONTAM: hypothetical protein FKN15_000487 [Acipenser sinensis]